MSDRHKRQRKRNQSRRPGGPQASGAQPITVRTVAGMDGWEFVYPPKVLRRQEDLEEVRAMLDAGEIDVAVDELRWLLAGCRELLEAHRLLGEIALADNDLPLAQGHFAYAYEMGRNALRQAKDFSGLLPYARPANQPFLEAGKGLAHCLRQQGDEKRANQIVRELLSLDPSDPLGVRGQ